jgi:hypothetical protein
MLQMKKNTKTKVGAVAASGLALASIFGLVHQNALPSASTGTASAQQVTTTFLQPPAAVASANSNAAAAVTPASTAAGQSMKAAVTPVVNTRTHVS